MPVDVAIQRVLAYRREVAMLQFTLDEDLKDLMHLQVLLSSHSSPSHSPRPLERPSASASASPVPSTNHSVLSSLSSPSPSPVPSTNLSGIKQKELTNCLQYLQPEQPGLSHGSVMLKDR
ncbi:hypothetical protein CMV_011842 [Castanea mollissima]|uniref:Uncharacterized protein n=1 Tax=Castanea mollissima TaxID=60419 RepID=A0A8J4R2H9_9ROSI|nr:hypothetical protein CMV_011842 [Castanea mollissima]